MLSGSITWATSGLPTFLKGSPSSPAVEGPEMLAAYFLAAANELVPEGITAGIHRLADAMVEYAQTYAPWNDRTGAAREGLHAEVLTEDGRFMAALLHGVDYGKWLELRDNGRLGILLRTQEVFASRAAGIVSGEIKLALAGRGSKFRSSAGRFT